MSGSTFPRPDVLNRITRHFQLDARILTTPIEELEAQTALTEALSILAPEFSHLVSGFDHDRVPDGLYVIALPKLVDPLIVSTTLIQLKTLRPGTVVVHWALPIYYAHLTATSTKWKDRRSTGIALQHVDGVSFIFTHPTARVMRCVYLSYGFQGLSNIHTGVVMSTTPAPGGQLSAYPVILEQVPNTFAHHMAARRRCGSTARENAPEAFKQHARNTGFRI